MILEYSDSLEAFSAVGTGGADSPKTTGSNRGQHSLPYWCVQSNHQSLAEQIYHQATDSGPWNGEERYSTQCPFTGVWNNQDVSPMCQGKTAACLGKKARSGDLPCLPWLGGSLGGDFRDKRVQVPLAFFDHLFSIPSPANMVPSGETEVAVCYSTRSPSFHIWEGLIPASSFPVSSLWEIRDGMKGGAPRVLLFLWKLLQLLLPFSISYILEMASSPP